MEQQELCRILEDLKQLQFDEKWHTYHLNGMRLPSVSALMKPLSGEYYKSIDPAILNAAAERGTAVHQAIEIYWKNDGFVDMPRGNEGYMEAFLKFVSDYKPEPLASEIRFWHKQLLYAGTADMVCTIRGAEELWVVDYKTSATINKVLTKIQLEAYKQGLASHGFKVPRKAILHLKKDGTYTFDDEYEEHDKQANTSWLDGEDMLKNTTCLDDVEIMDYMDCYTHRKFYCWNISDLEVYDNPKELSEFVGVCRKSCLNCKYVKNV